MKVQTILSLQREISRDTISRKLGLLLSTMRKRRWSKYAKKYFLKFYVNDDYVYDMKKQSESIMLHLLPTCVIGSLSEDCLSLIENVILISYQMFKATCLSDVLVALTTFYKLQGTKGQYGLNSDIFSNIQKYCKQLLNGFNFVKQSQKAVENFFCSSKEALSTWPKLKKTEIWEKIRKMTLFTSASALYSKNKEANIHAKYIAKIDKEIYKDPSVFHVDVVHSVLDCFLTLCERGYAFFCTGDYSVIFHTGDSYEDWYNKASELVAQSKYLCNPKPHGIDIHSYEKQLGVLLKQGQEIIKVGVDMPKSTKSIVRGLTFKLQEIKSQIVNDHSSTGTRRAPIAFVIEGDVGIGKSSFQDLLHFRYAFLQGKDNSLSNRFPLSARAKFWDRFKSYQYSLLVDDMGSENPNMMREIPEGMNCLLGVLNNAPFMPNMASLDEKGQTPFTGELVCISTNSPNLHLHHYFATPAAAARRMDKHIRLSVKPQYQDADGKLDTSKLPKSLPNEYPDWWIIQIYRVKLFKAPKENADHDPFNKPFKLVKTDEYDNVTDFLKWFDGEVEKHVFIQDCIERSINNLKDCEYCQKCTMPKLQCYCMEKQSLQSTVYWICSTYTKIWFYAFMFQLISALLQLTYLNAFYTFGDYMKDVVYRMFWSYLNYQQDRLKLKILNGYYSAREFCAEKYKKIKRLDPVHYIKLAGAYAALYMNYPKHIMILAAALVTVISLYVMYKSHTTHMDMQSHVESGERPTGEEKENVWYQDKFEVSPLDLGRLTKSWKGLTYDEIEARVVKNLIRCTFYQNDGNKLISESCSAFCLGGQTYITTSHSVPYTPEVPIDILVPSKNSFGSRTRCVLRQKDFLRLGRFCLFRIHRLPPKSDLTQLLMNNSAIHYKGRAVSLGVEKDGSIRKDKVTAMHSHLVSCPDEDNVMSLCGTINGDSKDGDCGSVFILLTGAGPVIGGLHEFGKGDRVGCSVIDRDILAEYIDLGKLTDAGKPELKSQSATKILGDLHVKSPARFIPEGDAIIYGSFVGFRGHLKTRVKKTMLYETMVDNGYTTDLEPPVLKGWKPVYANMKKLTRSSYPIDMDILEESALGLLDDWLEIDTEELKLLTIYDDVTITNGAPGVRFVDPINRKTSAGFPWNKSKRYFMDDVKIDGFDNPKVFKKEILDRAEIIISKYLNHERACPVFSGSLKDKAVTHRKNEEGGVRMFMGAPVDFTYVMRKYLLSFVRVMQRNKFTFESAPGIEAQCAEWNALYQYLTTFNDTNCVFGDFKGFDTTMPPEFLLAAFDIIIKFHQIAGCSEDHLTILTGIMYDVVFPYADIKGDLVMLIGKNPSGHALTVTINCVVNCLYMRYCFKKITGRPCTEFKNYVKLMTYGDDNGMNVSRLLPEFNHVSISEALGTIGITYTMPDKTSESVPYISIEDASFLKRSFRYESELEAVVCPLEESSIVSSLMIGEKSAFIGEEEQICSVICSANDEWFWYGRDYFEEKHRFLLKLIDMHELQDMMPCKLASWHELKSRYEHASQAYFNNSDIEKWAGSKRDSDLLYDMDKQSLRKTINIKNTYFILLCIFDIMCLIFLCLLNNDLPKTCVHDYFYFHQQYQKSTETMILKPDIDQLWKQSTVFCDFIMKSNSATLFGNVLTLCLAFNAMFIFVLHGKTVLTLWAFLSFRLSMLNNHFVILLMLYMAYQFGSYW